MPITHEIRESGHVSYYEMSDPWQGNDLTRLYPQDIAYRDRVNHKVHTVMDVTRARRVPANVISVRQGAPAFIHRNSGQLIMIGAQSFVKTMAEMIFKLAHYERARFFNTPEEGWNYVRQLIAEEEGVAQR